jgi:hypothetical protein
MLMTRGLVVVVVAFAAAGIGGAPAASSATGITPNAIAAENARPGTTSWFIDTPRQDEISGYFDDVSYLPGDAATLSVDSHGDPFSYTVYRMGYYDGLGGRKIMSEDVGANDVQPTPTVDGDFNGGAKLLTTGWHNSAVIDVGADWVSGYYLVKLHDDANGGESYANFTLRATTPAPIVINLSTNTWQAYNLYGNLSLYRDARVPAIAHHAGVAREVSFLRPYASGWGAGQFFHYDRPLVEWAESQGYPVSYSTDEDVRLAREAGPETKLVIFSGHEEYYSMPDRSELLRLTAAGVSEAFFGGNAWAWQARFDDTTHVMSVWRKKSVDPLKVPPLKTVRWEAVGLPQDALTGTMQTWGTQTGSQGAYATAKWPWNGAGVVSGEDLGPVEGTEWDGITVNAVLPTNLLMLSRTPFSGMPGVPANQAMTLWQKTPSAFVFAAGQIGFNWALSYPGVAPPLWVDPHYPASAQTSPAIERLAGNIIERATGIANPVPEIAPSGVAAPFALLSPHPGQYVKAAPSRLVVSWSDPPAGTATVRVTVDGAVVGSTHAGGNVLVTNGIATRGRHAIRLAAVAPSGDILATARERVIVLRANAATFQQNVNNISRLWGDDDSGTVGARACFRTTPAA